jgi:hypothetical protein
MPVSDAAASLRELAAPLEFGEPVKVVVERAARRVRPFLATFKFSRAYEIWYRRARRIEQFELDAIAQALDKKRREAARNELHELRTTIERLESRLAQIDPDFHRPSIDAARGQIRTLHGIRRTPDSSMD